GARLRARGILGGVAPPPAAREGEGAGDALQVREKAMDATKTAAVGNPVAALRDYGQSVWLDFIRRSLIAGGELKRLVDEDGLGGVTSNPAIFEKAIDGSEDYKSAIEEISSDAGLAPRQIFERLAVRDIQDAADVLR